MKFGIVSVVLILALITPLLASAERGNVSAINVNSSHGAVFIQLASESDSSTSVRFETDEVCVNDWVFVSTTDEKHADLIMSMAMSAKATGEIVLISTDGCGNTLLGTKYPKLKWMDYGERI